MSRPSRILAVDAGNTRVKWALYKNPAFVSEDWFATDDPERLGDQWSSLAVPDSVVIANVAGDAVGEYLKRGCERWGLSPTWVSGRPEQCGVTNTYDNPEQLGPDRWAALIGVHARSPGNRVVVCMGTATTIDALTISGEFLGGMILPGVDMMRALLASKTARLGSERGEVVSFPHSTRDAISTGAVRATCGAIEHMRIEMQQAGHTDVSVVATGGAAPGFSSMCKCPMVLCDGLVLQGLVRIGQSLIEESR